MTHKACRKARDPIPVSCAPVSVIFPSLFHDPLFYILRTMCTRLSALLFPSSPAISVMSAWPCEHKRKWHFCVPVTNASRNNFVFFVDCLLRESFLHRNFWIVLFFSFYVHRTEDEGHTRVEVNRREKDEKNEKKNLSSFIFESLKTRHFGLFAETIWKYERRKLERLAG